MRQPKLTVVRGDVEIRGVMAASQWKQFVGRERTARIRHGPGAPTPHDTSRLERSCHMSSGHVCVSQGRFFAAQTTHKLRHTVNRLQRLSSLSHRLEPGSHILSRTFVPSHHEEPDCSPLHKLALDTLILTMTSVSTLCQRQFHSNRQRSCHGRTHKDTAGIVVSQSASSPA